MVTTVTVPVSPMRAMTATATVMVAATMMAMKKINEQQALGRASPAAPASPASPAASASPASPAVAEETAMTPPAGSDVSLSAPAPASASAASTTSTAKTTAKTDAHAAKTDAHAAKTDAHAAKAKVKARMPPTTTAPPAKMREPHPLDVLAAALHRAAVPSGRNNDNKDDQDEESKEADEEVDQAAAARVHVRARDCEQSQSQSDYEAARMRCAATAMYVPYAAKLIQTTHGDALVGAARVSSHMQEVRHAATSMVAAIAAAVKATQTAAAGARADAAADVNANATKNNNKVSVDAVILGRYWDFKQHLAVLSQTVEFMNGTAVSQATLVGNELGRASHYMWEAEARAAAMSAKLAARDREVLAPREALQLAQDEAAAAVAAVNAMKTYSSSSTSPSAVKELHHSFGKATVIPADTDVDIDECTDEDTEEETDSDEDDAFDSLVVTEAEAVLLWPGGEEVGSDLDSPLQEVTTSTTNDDVAMGSPTAPTVTAESKTKTSVKMPVKATAKTTTRTTAKQSEIPAPKFNVRVGQHAPRVAYEPELAPVRPLPLPQARPVPLPLPSPTVTATAASAALAPAMVRPATSASASAMRDNKSKTPAVKTAKMKPVKPAAVANAAPRSLLTAPAASVSAASAATATTTTTRGSVSGTATAPTTARTRPGHRAVKASSQVRAWRN